MGSETCAYLQLQRGHSSFRILKSGEKEKQQAIQQSGHCKHNKGVFVYVSIYNQS